ncbi:hypothetical protein PVIIG_06231 [Plasmodium vivax India VII]|uniref:Variable surface protein Vir7-like protein n=1 Tax=Plasmodium vivax India VII TaxID=1077284 RepID=A0A0J9V8T8_PLAVI|nr:hypothetical protein PVIIG_06231 [Plasmodium vivax India VII]
MIKGKKYVIDYDMKVKDIKKFKVIFDYSQDYDTYMEQLTQDSLKCTENYKNYLQNYVNSYKELQTECESEHNSYKYCDDFKKYISNKDPKHLSTRISKLKVIKEQSDQTKEDSTGEVEHTQLQRILREVPGSGGQLRPSGPHLDSSSNGMGITPSLSNGPPTTITSKSITAIASTAGFLVPSFLMYKVISIINIVI